jgi:hypothetical protein
MAYCARKDSAKTGLERDLKGHLLMVLGSPA